MGMFLGPPPADPLRIRLAHALGFPNYPNDDTVEPYINYLLNQHDARGTPEYEDLLITIVQYFHGPQPLGSMKRSIEGLLHSLSNHPNTQWHEEDTVVRAIGSCTLLLSSFTDLPTVAGKLRMVTASYNLRMHGSLLGGQPYFESLAELVAGSGLLPAPVAFASVVTMADLESLESLFVDATHLNAYRLTVFGAVEITWTHNISRHLLLSNRNGRRILEIFALPCALDAAPLRMVGVGNELAQEVMESYSLLFNAWPSLGPHAKLGLWESTIKHSWPLPFSDLDITQDTDGSLFQTASHLPSELHVMLDDHVIAGQDPLYALAPILLFAAASEIQLLSTLQKWYDIIASTKWDRKYSTEHLEQLIMHKHLLDDHASRHEEVIRFISSPKLARWAANLTQDQSDVAQEAKDAVKADFEFLRSRCRQLSLHYQEAISILVSATSLAESQKQITLATQVTKLTILATIFLPLSYCTSIFGMNFVELEQLNIWIWVVVTVSIGLATFAIYQWDERQRLWDLWAKVKAKFRLVRWQHDLSTTV
ncbi:uncharacterized protein J4E87_008294 [Alternaria ethzedia]|uniref:uncharacterized protein n=1 Tax=Alternaria ethzedia TaxID=181014 RepID=UPI0020C5A644|nr:uncharacterized protein J4E87_008294 [Alternaria ethzedia]KAI4617658.1 hypothetical protein J4E87_008294 [Alternaria ethzedia]